MEVSCNLYIFVVWTLQVILAFHCEILTDKFAAWPRALSIYWRLLLDFQISTTALGECQDAKPYLKLGSIYQFQVITNLSIHDFRAT